jgi:hypothetical protein
MGQRKKSYHRVGRYRTDNDQAKGFYAALGLSHTTVAYFEKE